MANRVAPQGADSRHRIRRRADAPPNLDESGVEVAGDILLNFVAGGKCLRSTFMYLGWLAGAADSDEALFASARLELLHAFALLQDDVMDAVVVAARPARRARPVQPMASQAEAVRSGGALRRISGDPAGRSLPDLGRADAPGERRRASPSAAGLAALRRHAHRAGDGPVRRSGKRCPRPAVDGRRCWRWRGASRAITPCAGRWRSVRR